MRLLRLLVPFLCLALSAGGTPTIQAKPEAIPPGHALFRAYGEEAGLGNLVPLCLDQDRAGFLWVGTEDGLYRYDGRRFVGFNTSDGLPSGYITDIVEDGHGVHWVGTFNGLARWTGSGFAAVPGLPAQTVADLAVGMDGRLVAAFPSGIFINPQEGAFEAVSGWKGGDPTALFVESSGIWAAGQVGGTLYLGCFDGKSWKSFPTDALKGHRIGGIQGDANGHLWIRTQNGLWSLDPKTSRLSENDSNLPVTGSRARLRMQPDGALLVPTDEGLWILKDGKWSSLGSENGLPSPLVRDAMEDREGSLWIGGLGLYRRLGAGLWSAYTKDDGLPDPAVWTIFRSREGILYAGTGKGLAEAGKDGWKAVSPLKGFALRSVVEAADGSFYLSTSPASILHWKPGQKAVDASYGVASGITAKRIFRLVLDGNGVLWAATEGQGILRADTSSHPLRFTQEDIPLGSKDETFTGLVQGASGRIYACGVNGLAVLQHGQWRRYTRQDGLKLDHAAFALELADGTFVVAYFESTELSHFKFGQGGALEPLPDLGGSKIRKEKVYMLGQDARGELWIGTGRGVFMGHDGTFQHFGTSDGLVNEDISNMAFWSDPGGNVWVGTSSGLARFDNSAYTGPHAPPPTVFLKVGFGAKPGSGIAESGTSVPHKNATLQAEVAGLTFLAEGNLHFQVRMDGLEDAWHETDSGEVRYPALSPGDYVLRVRSRAGDGPWGAEAVFPFTVLPSWWQSWWFRTLAVLALGGCVVGIIRWRVSALRRHNLELAALVHERTEALESANEALKNQSLTDSLTGLKNRRYLGATMPEDVAQVRRIHRELNANRLQRSHENVDLALVMVDLDHFKEVNDVHGHGAGDQVLKQVSEILQSATRDTDTVVRWGGEEFLIVARNAARKDAMVLVERIRARVEAHAFDLGDGSTIKRTCSIGFALMPFLCAEPEFMSWEEVVDVADHCLYVAKRSGRNGWVGVLPGMNVVSDQLGKHVGSHLPDLVKTPLVEVISSFSEGTKLDWWG